MPAFCACGDAFTALALDTRCVATDYDRPSIPLARNQCADWLDPNVSAAEILLFSHEGSLRVQGLWRPAATAPPTLLWAVREPQPARAVARRSKATSEKDKLLNALISLAEDSNLPPQLPTTGSRALFDQRSDYQLTSYNANDNLILTPVVHVETMSFLALDCTLMAVDGDTLRCGDELIRLIGIDAPELPGHCQEGRDCAPGDPVESKRALDTLSRGTALISRQGRDLYGRTLARVQVNGVDLSCAQLAGGRAIYRADWDQFGSVGTDCSVLESREAERNAPRRQRAQTDRSASNARSVSWSYRNCAEARRAGAAPLLRGTPGYGPHMDGDGDGIACEPFRR